MRATRETMPAPAPRDLRRWMVCIALAFAAHAAAAAAVISSWGKPYDEIVSAPLLVVELAPMAVAPETAPSEIAPGPEQIEAAAKPAGDSQEDKSDEPIAAPVPMAQTPAPSGTDEAKPNSPSPREAAPITSAPSPAERRAQRAAAPAPGAAMRSSALPNWQSALVARLERAKRYPPDARGERGVALLSFRVDRQGGVHGARIARSSGSAALDRETLALAARAQPLPAPPPELTGAQIPVTVPLRYNME
jgi:protein TonB